MSVSRHLARCQEKSASIFQEGAFVLVSQETMKQKIHAVQVCYIKVYMRHLTIFMYSTVQKCELMLGPVQTSNFTCAECNANEQNLLSLLISIRFGTCDVRRLNQA